MSMCVCVCVSVIVIFDYIFKNDLNVYLHFYF